VFWCGACFGAGVRLRQLRNEFDDLVLWADQLCINQDDYAEKASQIQKMGSIYKKARRVIAWLGIPANDSDLVFTTLRQIDKHHNLSLKTGLLSGIARELEQTTSNSHDRIWDATKILETLRTALPAFAARRYWTRLWVLQEFVLATNVLIMCGSKIITDISLGNAWEILGKTANNPDDIAGRETSTTSDIIAIADTWRFATFCGGTHGSELCVSSPNGIITTRATYTKVFTI
jgi:Heterokaryon incompatibility protein (HET)